MWFLSNTKLKFHLTQLISSQTPQAYVGNLRETSEYWRTQLSQHLNCTTHEKKSQKLFICNRGLHRLLSQSSTTVLGTPASLWSAYQEPGQESILSGGYSSTSISPIYLTTLEHRLIHQLKGKLTMTYIPHTWDSCLIPNVEIHLIYTPVPPQRTPQQASTSHRQKTTDSFQGRRSKLARLLDSKTHGTKTDPSPLAILLQKVSEAHV